MLLKGASQDLLSGFVMVVGAGQSSLFNSCCTCRSGDISGL